MLRKFRERMESEKGFTLIELLVVILIIGILAAIALPVFLGQRSKGQDADAKSNARNLVSHVESHFATEEKYTGADKSDEVVNSGITLGSGKGQVALTVTDDTFKIIGNSESGNTFTIEKASNGTITRTCTKLGDGACPESGKW